MGHEVLYCRGCGTRMGGSALEESDVIRTELGTWCPNCSNSQLASLPPEHQEAILKAGLDRDMAEARQASASQAPRPVHPRFRAHGLPGRRNRRLPAARGGSSAGIVIAVVVGLAILVALILAAS